MSRSPAMTPGDIETGARPRATGARAPAGETPLVVSTRCPTCSAPLDFAAGSNAIRCAHCGSNLLATGRGQVLSYLVRPRVGGADARSVARFATASRGAAIVAEPRLVFVPYFRLTATELRWQRRAGADPGEEPRSALLDTGASGITGLLGRLRDRDAAALPRHLRAVPGRPAAPEFAARRIERTLNAAGAGALGAPSLGVRSGVVELELFRADALPADAIALEAGLSPADALATALTPTGDEELVERAVVERVLSVLHFPLWTIRTEERGAARLALIDGLTGSLVETDASVEALARARAARGELPTVGFRPLACPNCGWDLAVEPTAVAFPCAGCERAWLLEGTELRPQPTTVALPPAADGGERVDYRPFWEVTGPAVGDAPPSPWLVPAFRHGNLKRLRDLALRLSRRRPSFVAIPAGNARAELGGCVLDAADAAEIARFLAATGGHDPGRPAARGPVHGSAAAPSALAPPQLLWLPFVRDAYGWREPLTGTALPPELAA